VSIEKAEARFAVGLDQPDRFESTPNMDASTIRATSFRLSGSCPGAAPEARGRARPATAGREEAQGQRAHCVRKAGF